MIHSYGRKFTLCVAVLVASLPLVACGLLAGGEFVTLVLGTIGAYIAGNVAQKSVLANVSKD
jgi:hypothetical protein